MTQATEAADRDARVAARNLQEEALTADEKALRLLFTEARTHYGWQDRDVDASLLRRMYEIAKMGPTSMNQQPMRVIFALQGSQGPA